MPDAIEHHVSAIFELFDEADVLGLPLWLESGWAIDARLGVINRVHDDIDIAFPGDRRADYLGLIERLGYGGHEHEDYGFLSRRPGVLLDSEPCARAGDGHHFLGFPLGSCPADRRGRIRGRAIRCLSWEAIYFEMLGYIRDVPEGEWRPKDFSGLEVVRSQLPDEARRRLEDMHAEIA